jgi:hypothetical protein
MKTITFMLGIGFALTVGGTGCDGGHEGDRCVLPIVTTDAGTSGYRSSDECGSGLACTQPANCPESYCCPTNGTSSNPNCKPGCNGGADSICAANPTACADAASGDAAGDAMKDAPSDVVGQ